MIVLRKLVTSLSMESTICLKGENSNLDSGFQGELFISASGLSE